MGRNHASTLTCEILRKRARLLLWLAVLLCALGPFRRQSARAQGAATAIEIEPGKPVEGVIAPGQTQIYRMALLAGRFSLITVQQRGIDLVERVFAPAGDLVARFDSEGEPHGADRVEFVAETSGVYRIEVSAKLKRAESRFDIGVSETRAANERDWSLHESNRLATESADLYRAGKYDEAARAAAHALEARERALGPEHARLAVLFR